MTLREFKPKKNRLLPLRFTEKTLHFIFRNRQETFRLFVTFLCLKRLFIGGIVKDYTNKLSRIANYFEIGESTLRRHICELKRLGWVRIENGSLLLTSLHKIKLPDGTPIEYHNVDFETGEVYRVYKKRYMTDLYLWKDIYDYIEVLAINENLIKQKGAINCKKVKFYQQYIGGKSDTAQDAVAYQYKDDNMTAAEINPEITISRRSIAKSLGLKSSKCAHERVNKWKYMKVVKDEKKEMEIQRKTKQEMKDCPSGTRVYDFSRNALLTYSILVTIISYTNKISIYDMYSYC